MEKMGLNEIRKMFLEFFESKGHLAVPSASLVPHNDNSVLLIIAGMAPLKPYFAGTEVPPKNRMASCQKCIRTDDIENVGKTSRHATFFEMLGNFSFGDYFKKESIQWGWEFVTDYLKLPLDKVWVSVYEEDDEAYEIWNKQVGVPADKIVRLGKADNFWEIGVGPCGPCSEIYFDRGEKYGCGHEACKPGCDCDRFVEFWNHVFTQFDRDEAGNYNPLPNPNIDTGMGLERIACIMQGVDSIFDVDTMKYILEQVCEKTSAQYNQDTKTNTSIRIITDHIRSVTFMVSDGIIPSNEGRGYVLRKLLRRAARHGKLLGRTTTFLYELVDAVIKMYGETYTELQEKREYIQRVIKVEEERFQETIHQGIDILNEYIETMEKEGIKQLSGEAAFKLYDTFGFPLDLTKEILEEKGLEVDEASFQEEMEKQRNRARKARSGEDHEGWKEDIFATLDRDIQTTFKGYGNLEGEGKVLSIIHENATVKEINAGEEATIILDETPFYGEGGGQVGDQGRIFNDNFIATVVDTKKGINNRIHLMVQVQEGKLALGDNIKGEVNESTRKNTERNHTATHLLHKALKEIVGNHVQQAGSLVTPERLRFDFTHFEGLTEEQIKSIEEILNTKILAALAVEAFETSIKEAKEMGAEALFGEKYGETVRVVKAGDFSTELCGGTHVKNTSEIGTFLILSEAGVAAGTRRIEALTGSEAYKYINQQRNTVARAAEVVKTQEALLINRLEAIMAELKEKDREIDRLKSQLASGATDQILADATMVNDAKVIVHHMGETNMDDLRKVADVLKEKVTTGVIVLAGENDGKANFVTVVTKDLTKKGIHAGNLVKEAAKVTGGGGGGRPDMAQAGGKDATKINEALETVKSLLMPQLG
ncbi:alanine--tRNA ligase [Alkaliphilus hydrothermalis]|uniref:Alanine--tRNA ligase n=1 Tax=Alkaliphilus hydrothermalis TaxID=1482730 RepID=A0ABS2NLX7_9FIRM|nr:alanine--tRNA ligase [Alkaliphilus hydrothermalis]MBM7613950.1 alanyl-tRNA synthetase [Alkaliphilus hydrothermalis]